MIAIAFVPCCHLWKVSDPLSVDLQILLMITLGVVSEVPCEMLRCRRTSRHFGYNVLNEARTAAQLCRLIGAHCSVAAL
jgi:hypothetical protein